jgi:hypothetical protein
MPAIWAGMVGDGVEFEAVDLPSKQAHRATVQRPSLRVHDLQ